MIIIIALSLIAFASFITSLVLSINHKHVFSTHVALLIMILSLMTVVSLTS